jgi:hypothetical protein
VIALVRRRIRLERPQLLLLALCVFFMLANVFLVSSYLQSTRDRDALLAQVTTIERAVQRLQSRGTTASQLANPLQPGENPFPQQLPTADLTNLVTLAAQQSGARIDAMTPQLGSGERLALGTYRTYKLSLRVSGGTSQLADFLNRLERGPVRSWVIDNAQARPTAPGTWDLTFDVTTYAQGA